MKITKHYCDRCGIELEEIIEVEIYVSTDQIPNMEYCEECKNKLVEWINEKPKESSCLKKQSS